MPRSLRGGRMPTTFTGISRHTQTQKVWILFSDTSLTLMALSFSYSSPSVQLACDIPTSVNSWSVNITGGLTCPLPSGSSLKKSQWTTSNWPSRRPSKSWNTMFYSYSSPSSPSTKTEIWCSEIFLLPGAQAGRTCRLQGSQLSELLHLAVTVSILQDLRKTETNKAHQFTVKYIKSWWIKTHILKGITVKCRNV